MVVLTYKMAIVVRSDIKMSCGKIAAQASHAAVECYKSVSAYKRRAWTSEGQKKIVLAANLDEIKSLVKKCKKMGVNAVEIHDAGMTEVPSGTLTCIGVGPDREDRINKITGSLPLLK